MADINTDQWFPSVVLGITNSAGAPAQVDGIPVWASSDETVLALTVNPDGMGASVMTVGPGVWRISVTADADLGAGVQTISGYSETVNVTLGPSQMASTFTFTFGPPTDKPTP